MASNAYPRWHLEQTSHPAKAATHRRKPKTKGSSSSRQRRTLAVELRPRNFGLRRPCALRDVPQSHHVPCQADFFHQPDKIVRGVDLVPAMALAGDALIGVMVVMPTLAERQQ